MIITLPLQDLLSTLQCCLRSPVCFFCAVCCSAWVTVGMYGVVQATEAEWLPSWPQCDRAVSTWRWPSLWILSAQLACQVLQVTWSIKHLNDDHCLMHSPSRPILLDISVYICNAESTPLYGVYFFCTSILVQRVLTCTQLLSEGRFWLGLDAW